MWLRTWQSVKGRAVRASVVGDLGVFAGMYCWEFVDGCCIALYSSTATVLTLWVVLIFHFPPHIGLY